RGWRPYLRARCTGARRTKILVGRLKKKDAGSVDPAGSGSSYQQGDATVTNRKTKSVLLWVVQGLSHCGLLGCRRQSWLMVGGKRCVPPRSLKTRVGEKRGELAC